MRKIHQILNQEGGNTVDDLLAEEEVIVNAFKSNNIPKLTAFMCERENLLKLIQYAVKFPQNTDSHEKTYK